MSARDRVGCQLDGTVGLGLGTPTYQGQYLDVVKLVP